MPRETDPWPYIPAKHQGSVRDASTVRHIVVHDMEAPELSTTAEAVTRYFQRGTVVASAHVCVDDENIFQSVYDGRVAYHAPGASHDGLGLEQAGYAKQTAAEWTDAFSYRMITERSADVVAQWGLKFGIPMEWLTDEQLRDNWKGIVSHDQVSRVFKRSSHWDPGPHYPQGLLLEAAKDWQHRHLTAGTVADPVEVVRDPIPPVDYEVAVVFQHAPDEGAARVLGTAHGWRVLDRDQLAVTKVALVIPVGWGEGGFRGENRTETARLTAAGVCNKDWAQDMTQRGHDRAREMQKG